MWRTKASLTLGAAAPWCLGAALVVSLSANAGEEISFGVSIAPPPVRTQGAPAQPVPSPADGREFDGFARGATRLLQHASLTVGASDEFKRLPDEIEPRAGLKHNAGGFPEIDRSRKGDPLAGLRPALDASLPYGSESEGQAAAGQAVRNRAASRLYPPPICNAVSNNRRYGSCQFSFACGGKALRITGPAGWQQAQGIAAKNPDGPAYPVDLAGSTHFHANYIDPRWARRLEKAGIIGHHVCIC